MSILFINGSPNKNGNTVALSEQFLKGKNYQTLHLVDYKIYSYGQHFTDDQFDEVVLAMSKADTIVIGSPLYWHSMSGAVRNLLDRFYQHVFYLPRLCSNETTIRSRGIYNAAFCKFIWNELSWDDY